MISVIYNILELIATFIESYFSYRFLELFMVQKMQKRKCLLLALVLSLLINYINFYSLFSLSTLPIAILFVTVTARWLFKVPVFESFSISSFYSFCLLFFDFFSIAIIGFCIKNNNFAADVIKTRSIYRYVFVFVSKLLLLIGYVTARKLLIKIGILKTRKLLFITIFGYIGIMYFAKSTYEYIDMNIVINWLLFFSTTIFTLFSLIVYIRYLKVSEEKKNIEIRNRATAENYKEMAQNYKKNSQLYHDMKNHILIINNLLEKGDNKQAEKYIKTIYEIVKVKNYTWTGNDIIDCIINIKKTNCEQENITLLIDTDPIYIELDAFVISTIFSNLLDNAIEASSKLECESPIVTVSIRCINDMIITKIENSIKKIPLTVDGNLVTQKRDKKEHGWGIKSVEEVVEKIGGVFTYSFNANTFTAIVTLFIL